MLINAKFIVSSEWFSSFSECGIVNLKYCLNRPNQNLNHLKTLRHTTIFNQSFRYDKYKTRYRFSADLRSRSHRNIKSFSLFAAYWS